MERQAHESCLLLIDDDRDIVSMVTNALREIGWHVITCEDPAEAHALAATARPDVVLLDIYLAPPASGWRVLEALRDDVATHHVPVVIFSSQIKELEEKEAWLLEQRIGVLSKPFELEDLYDAVEEFQRSPSSPANSAATSRNTSVVAD